MARQVFYSFHYRNDVRRVALIRNIGALEGNKPVSDNDWEQVKKGGDGAIKKWIDGNMKYRSCVIVLIGTETWKRKWVRYEIEKAFRDGKTIFGIYIHNIADPIYGKCSKGLNPFDYVVINGTKLSNCITCYDPKPFDAYNDIRANLSKWVEIETLKNRKLNPNILRGF